MFQGAENPPLGRHCPWCAERLQAFAPVRPKNVAIMGFGNFDVAMVSSPQITTVDVHVNEIGGGVFGVLQDVFDDKLIHQKIDVGSKLMIGETS